MQRTFCDRCGEEITQSYDCGLDIYTYIEKGHRNRAINNGHVELCEKCNNRLRDWFYHIKRDPET